MFKKDARKETLQQLRDQLAALSAELPREAGGLRRAIAAVDGEIAQRIKPTLLGIKAADLEVLEARVAQLNSVAHDLPGLIRDLTTAIQAERTLANKTARGGDRELAEWQARRGRQRETQLATAADPVSDSETLAIARKTLKELAEQNTHDAAALSLFDEARERVRTLGGGGDGKALADALPGFRQQLIGHGPQPAWAQGLFALVKPLRGLQPRQRPPQLEQVFERLERLSDWIEVLRDETTEAAHPGENRLRRLSTRYHELTANEGWRAVEQAVVDNLLGETTTLEEELVAQAETERGALTDELARNADMFERLADAELTPGLGDVLRKLLVETPDGPEAFGGWRSRCRRANERFREAIGADSGRIEQTGEGFAAELQRWVDELAKLPLDQPDGAEHTRIGRGLDAQRRLIGADLPVPRMLDALASLSTLRDDGERLHRRAKAKAARLFRHRRALCERARRLQVLARVATRLDDRSDTAVAEQLAALAQPGVQPADLDQGRQELERSRRLLGTLEHDLLQAAKRRGLEQLAELRGIAGLLDAPQRPVDPRLDAAWGLGVGLPRSRIERLVVDLPELETVLNNALQQQVEALLQRRGQLIAEAEDIDRDSMSGVDRATFNRSIATLRDCDRSRCPEPIELVRTLRTRLRMVERQLRRIADEQRNIDQTTRRLQERLARLQHEHFELGDRRHIDRVWALIQPVAGATQARGERRAQLQHAEVRLSALERHAQRIAATRFATHYQRLRERDDPEARALVDAVAAAPLQFPDHELRLRAKEIATRDGAPEDSR